MADAEALCGEPKASQNILLGITVGEVKAVVGLCTLDRNSSAPVSLGHLPDEPHTEKTFRAAAVTSVSQIIPQFWQLQIQISTHIVPPVYARWDINGTGQRLFHSVPAFFWK